TIGALRLDPVFTAEPGGTVDIAYISWKPDQRTLSVAVNGQGSVTSTPTGIQCPGTCSAQFADTASVTLEAKYGHGSAFAGWTGAYGVSVSRRTILDGHVCTAARWPVSRR